MRIPMETSRLHTVILEFESLLFEARFYIPLFTWSFWFRFVYRQFLLWDNYIFPLHLAHASTIPILHTLL